MALPFICCPPESFIGAGVYALYYIGNSPYYKCLYELNRLSFVQPIYVGKLGVGDKQEFMKRQMNYIPG